ncbi:hypothetical protein BM536_017820 [Streptomyces phaeoluteigriseus]|uniref:Uncharacterized protein n=1 Tax=Streptomyces phaeoluteigriseus TaxID=114686 RepID=A0A1V6MRW0_9ACTN|nr:hypothetical protein [Streptomyces phaeoluteigriseus]OQD55013.1 hypothetical protein BM536_017820 [Streptomyces phaeoluteigriseus]
MLPVAGVTAAVPTGCSLRIEEAMCGGGEHPVPAVGGTGGTGVPNEEEPPGGCVRCPQGKVPEIVGDEWDTYGSTRTLDERGNVVVAPDAG